MLNDLTLKKDIRTFSVSPENPTGEKGEGGKCSMPTATDENGVAVVRFDDLPGCGAKLLSKVEGYQKMEDYVYFEEGSREVTITLVPEEAAA
jgi:hypothetical protein